MTKGIKTFSLHDKNYDLATKSRIKIELKRLLSNIRLFIDQNPCGINSSLSYSFII